MVQESLESVSQSFVTIIPNSRKNWNIPEASLIMWEHKTMCTILLLMGIQMSNLREGSGRCQVSKWCFPGVSWGEACAQTAIVHFSCPSAHCLCLFHCLLCVTCSHCLLAVHTTLHSTIALVPISHVQASVVYQWGHLGKWFRAGQI